MSSTGEAGEPTKVGIPIADLLAGIYGAHGMLASLLDRERTGRGAVRTPPLASVVGVHAFQGSRWTVAGEVPTGAGNHHAAIAPYGLFRTADNTLQVAVGSKVQWRSFAAAVGLDADDARFATNDAAVQHRVELVNEIERIFATAPTSHWLAMLAKASTASGKFRTIADVYEWEQSRSQGPLIDVEHPMLGRVRLPGPRLCLDGMPTRRAWHDHLDGE